MATKLEQKEFRPFLENAPSSTNWLQGFGSATVGSIGEFFGFEKDLEQRKWEAQHPWSSLGADLVGYAVPYAGWEKAVTKLPAVRKVVSKIGDAEKSPILTSGLREAAKFAPLEAGRLAVAAGFGDRPFGDVATEAAIDLGAMGLLTGGATALSRYGKKRQKLSDLVPGADPVLPMQLQTRMAREFIKKNPETDPLVLETVGNRLSEMEKLIRTEEVVPGYRYVSPTEGGRSGKDINRLFDVARSTNSIERKLFMSGEKGFKAKVKNGRIVKGAQDSINEIWAKTGFGELREQLPYVQFPRFIQGKKVNGAGFVQGAIRRDMENIADNLWITRERNNGLYVVAKKVEGGTKAKAGDQWVIFKTDKPGRFAPVQENWAQNVADKAAWMAEPEKIAKATGSKIYDFTEKLTQQFPMMNFIGAAEPTTALAKQGKALGKKMGFDKVQGAQQAFEDFFGRYFLPSARQFTKSPRANWINSMSRAVYDEAERLSKVAMYGEHVIKDKNLWRASISGAVPKGTGNVKGLLDKLTDQDMWSVWKLWNKRQGADAVSKAFSNGEISAEAKAFMDHLSNLDDQMISQIQTTQAAFGQKLFTPLKDHYMISRTWAGDYRVPIHNEVGELVYMAAGKDKRGAEDLAQKIIKEAEGGWTAKPAFLSGRNIESPLEIGKYFTEMSINRPDAYKAAEAAERVYETSLPKFMQERVGVKGFIGEKAPWTKDELENILRTHLDQQHKYLAKLTVNERFGAERAKLLAEDPAMFQTLEDRMNDMAGKPGPLAEIQNKVMDKILAPVLGANSASKIARITNSTFMHLNLGAMTMGQPIVNAMTFMHTVLPEASFVLNAIPERLAPYYGVWPTMGSNGMVRGSVHALDPLRLMRRSFKEMGKPDAQLFKAFEKAASEGVVAPRMVEEYIGEGATTVMDLKKALKSGEGFAKWTLKLSESLMGGTEKLSRGNAFVVGHILGRDFMQLQGEQLYQFAKRFTQRTMYGYSTADRSRIFTTPVGSMFGLFKNWMTHFMGSMLQYTDDALLYGNWSPLLWQTAGLGAVGGMAATGPAYFLADNFSEMALDKPLMDATYDLFGSENKDVSDALFFGLPTLLGFSLSGSSAAPFANPTRDITQLFSFVQLDRANAIGKAMGGAIDQFEATGKNPLESQLVREQLSRAFLPKTLYRIMATWEDNAIKSLSTGAPNLKGVTPTERLMFAAGLNPTFVERTYRVSDQLWKDQKKMKEKVKSYGQAFFEAQQRQDQATMQSIMFKSMQEGIDFSRVLRSSSARLANEQTDMLERRFKPEDLWKKRHILER